MPWAESREFCYSEGDKGSMNAAAYGIGGAKEDPQRLWEPMLT